MEKSRSHDSSETSSISSEESVELTSGPDFAAFANSLSFKNSSLFPYNDGNEGFQDIIFPSTITTKEELPKTTDITTLFIIDSVNRDKLAFPQPTSFSLKLPRVYKNVKSIQLTEVKFLCSFYYFSAVKSNIYLPIIERGRGAITTFNNTSISKFVTIREGTYNINDLLSEIQTELNYTPLFYDFPNGFTDFINIFSSSGDYSINFNQPGDTYYDSLNSKYIMNPTMAIIISYYWGSRYAGLTNYSLNQLKVAYYYPVLYEVLLDLKDMTARPFLNLSSPPGYVSTDDLPVDSHVIFNMSGINDPVAEYLINNNLTLLDRYRLNHTFRYSLVNRYQVSYDTNSLHVNFITTTLNTSLVNLINNTASTALIGIFNNLGLTPASYSNIQSIISKTTIVYTDMFNFLQSQLASLVGISYATYTPSFFNNLSNSIYFQDGINALGIRINYDTAYINSGGILISTTITNYSDSPVYWPNLKSSNRYVGTDLINLNSSQVSIPYNVASGNFQYGTQTIDSNTYYLNINKTTHSLDILVNILPAQYTIIKFKSPVRQSLQVETLPLPYYYRYSDFNKAGLYKGVLDLSKNNVPQKYFDISYSYVYDITNSDMDILNYSPNILIGNFGDSFSRSLENASTFTINSLQNYYYFQFTAPYPEGLQDVLVANTTSLSIVSLNTSNISTLFTDNFTMFVYHDRGAFMADLGRPRAENPLHYIATKSISTNSGSDITINLSTFSGHNYYTIFRSNNITCANNVFKPLYYYKNNSNVIIDTTYTNFNPLANPFNTSNLSTYAFVSNYNTDFIRLPTASSLTSIDPTNSTFNTSLTVKGVPIGYDVNGISNDLTDYIGFNTAFQSVDPSSTFRFDPLTNYIFQTASPFNAISESYFGSNSLNAVLFPKTNNAYSFLPISTSQLKIVHWYEGYFIPQQLDDQVNDIDNIGILKTSSLSQVLTTFPVDANSNIVFGRGINAIGFLPKDGVYNVDTFTFKSSIYPITGEVSNSNDPNLQIKYIGVFSGLALENAVITLSSAITVMKFNTSVPYGPEINTESKFTFGTWYTYINDTSFISGNTTISGNTPSNISLLSYTSLYYMVPFDKDGIVLTYTLLSGSILPYPLEQNALFSTVYLNNQIATNIPGAQSQPGYIIPISKNISSLNKYGPSGVYSELESQYEQSMSITTPSIGYRQNSLLIRELNSPFLFTTIFNTTLGLTTHFSEFSDNLFIVNSTSNICSNANISFPTITYASSLSTIISVNSGNLSCINFMTHPASTINNYQIGGIRKYKNIFTFSEMAGDDSNITINSIELSLSMSNITLWMWGGGGGALSTTTGGAGAYVKVNINPTELLNTKTSDAPGGISTLYIVVGKGGNRDNFILEPVVGSLQSYEQARYGGGGTSLTGNYNNFNSITAQGGGFSGIFSGSNVLTATPLLIVGGGGAAGTVNIGGPGGFGVLPQLLPTSTYQFSTIIFNGVFFSYLPIQSITDVFNNPVLNGSNVRFAADNNLTTFWEPVIPSKMKPSNYYSTPNTYGVSLQFSTPITNISKLRFYGPPSTNLTNLPTGIIVYNDINRTQILFSDTSIQATDYQLINNGQFIQQIYECIPVAQVLSSTLNSNAWLAVGENDSPQTSIQYSLDLINWIPTKNTILSIVKSIQYVPAFGMWYACGSTIISSSDGINWTPCVVNSFTGSIFNTITYGNIPQLPNNNLVDALLAGGDNGTIYISFNGVVWTSAGKKFTTAVTRIRYLNGIFWALGETFLKKSLNGIVWNDVSFFLSNINDIAYINGKYFIAQICGQPPLSTGIIFSLDGITWANSGLNNLEQFSAYSIAYGNSTFVAAGNTTDGLSFIKYSFDGFNWFNSSFSILGDIERNDVQFIGGKFISVGQAKNGTGFAANQDSILSSLDGITWSYSSTGGFDSDSRVQNQGYFSGYGPVSIIPNLSTLYIEIQKTQNINIEPKIYDIRVYNESSPIISSTTPLFDNNLLSIFYPPELQTVDVIKYPFIMHFSTVIPLLNYIQIYTPNIPNAQFTSVSISLDSSENSTIYNKIVSSSTIYSGQTAYNLYNIQLIPELVNISTLYFVFTKITSGSLQIANINGYYDPNMKVAEDIPGIIQDLDLRLPNSSTQTISNVIDGDLSRYWSPRTFIQGDSLKLNFIFTTRVDRINHIQIFNGIYPPVTNNIITGISIFADSTKSITLYSSTSINFTQYKLYSMIDIDIPAYLECTTIYIELYKSTQGIPIINEVRFFNIGILTDSADGYSGGQSVLMTRTSIAYSGYNGGGGVLTNGGSPGTFANSGNYLTGGSPAILEANKAKGFTSALTVSAGGGGGGYYGGGGGGSIDDGTGGAGGGGSGYIFLEKPIFTILDYGVANPLFNFSSPALIEQNTLIITKILPIAEVNYGEGGNPLVNNGAAGHGIVIFSYEKFVNVIPNLNENIEPYFIDGSKLTVFQAPIEYITDSRSLAFTPYIDSIQYSPYSNYNWVWYSSYLSLVGITLLSSMQPSTLVTVQPPGFPYLPPSIYSQLSQRQLFNRINAFFNNAISDSQVITITSEINTIFISFQNNHFINTLFTDPSYIEMTEIYCLLDYLRNPSNLANPHVNPSNPTVERIFGGIPRFGYWANPFITNASYIGFDVAASQLPPPALSTLARASGTVQALYGLVLEQSLSSGIYGFKDIMAYKPTQRDSLNNGTGWLTVTQFTHAYAVRSLTDSINLDSNIIVQPYTFKNAIAARLPLFSYKVHSIPYKQGSVTYDIPVQILNDFEGQAITMCCFQNINQYDISSINISYLPFTSTMLNLNQASISRNISSLIIGTLVSEYQSTIVNVVTSFKFEKGSFTPLLTYSQGTNNYYNTYDSTSQFATLNLGKARIDYNQNYYITPNNGSNVLYQNVSSLIINPVAFPLSTINYASPRFILSEYNRGNQIPYSDFFESKFTNIWHFPANGIATSMYGARLTSPYDLSVVTSFANQVFYPTHKISFIKTGSITNPITNPLDTQVYPSYQRTEMFLYKSFSSLVADISGQFAMEKAANFSYSDSFSGYGFNSYLNNVQLTPSDSTDNPDSFNYLAIRAYSPTEKFQSLVRFYLPQRYDYGYITLLDLSNEQQNIQNLTDVNPDYRASLKLFNSVFSTNRVYGSVGIPGFSGSNISTTSFGDFLRQFNVINIINNSNNAIVSTVTGESNASLFNLINGDLQYILPSYLASRNRVTDPVEFSIPFSSCVSPANANSQQYGLGYNLGFTLHDTTFNTVQRATSFFKILDDYIYLQMNEEFKMNRMDISKPENFSRTRETTAQSGVYNSKLMLNTFGSFATTFVHSPVTFNPVVGKIDKLTFTWYNSAGVLLDNTDCEWSGSVQIVEAVNIT